MKSTQIIMGMPVTVEILDAGAAESAVGKVFKYFSAVDETFSTYKTTSEISRINRGELSVEDASADTQTVFKLSEETKKLTNGYFDIKTPSGSYDPSGLVKGWAIYRAARILKELNCQNFFIDAGGDIQASSLGKKIWSVGIRNPFNRGEIVKIIRIRNEGVATSGTYIRGQHIYNPHRPQEKLSEVVSITVVGPNVYEADRFATAAFAMGRDGIGFIEQLDVLEGYMIDSGGVATKTSGFGRYEIS